MAGDPETVKVVVRCRPFNKREINLKCKNVVFMDQKTYTCSIEQPNDPNAPPKSFTFDGVYGPDSTTEQIYNDNGFGLVEGVLEGYNGTVFAYGQTGCGKSFSMQGIPDPPTQRGIIPRAFEHIFEAIDSSENMKYLVHASYLEIYNEEIRDLLGKDVKKKLDLRENPDKGIYVDGISTHPVHNTQECEMLMDKGWKNRSTGATAMNADSSRSHSIFTINIEMLDTGVDGGQHIRKGKLNLVDLAGSERQSKTQAEGQRLKEANKINLSLSALGNVISALVDGKSTFIPYRDSKLTRMLQDSLGGNTKTMMVACLSPADNNYDETLSTLRYANRAKNIKNKPKINEDPKDALLREYQSEIQKLKEMLDNKPESSFVQAVPNEEILEAERRRVREEYDKEMQEIKQKFQSEQQSKAKMQEEIEEMRRHYEEKLQQVNERSVSVTAPSYTEMSYENEGFEEDDEEKKDNVRNEEQIKAMEKLRKLQEAMLEGGKRAGDKDLKERRLKKKKAAEKRLKVLGEALGHVDGEDGVLVKVYDDIQTELSEKTAALKRMKQRVKGLNSEISDLHSEFEKDRQDYLDTIRKQDQQLLLLQTILDKVQPTLRKDCNYSNIDKIKSEASWNDELESWYVPELVIHKTKLPPAGPMGGLSGSVSNGNGLLYPDSMGNSSTDSGSGRVSRVEPGQGLSRTAPGRLQIFDDDSGDEAASHLVKKLAKSEEEDIAGNYFKPKRANRLMAQAQMDKTTSSRSNLYSGNTSSAALLNSTLATSFNSGLNTVGLNNSYVSTGGKLSGAGMGGMGSNDYRNWGQTSSNPSWLSNGGGTGGLGGYSSSNIHAAGDIAPIRKPTRLEALPGMGVGGGGGLGKSNIKSKKSVPVLNTMGTF